MVEKRLNKWTCDMYYLFCPYRDNIEDTSREFGYKKKYFRYFCKSEGMYDGKPCRHTYLNDKRLIPRKYSPPRNSKVRIISKGVFK